MTRTRAWCRDRTKLSLLSIPTGSVFSAPTTRCRYEWQDGTNFSEITVGEVLSPTTVRCEPPVHAVPSAVKLDVACDGSVFSGQPMAASLLDLQGKEGLHQPWDVHAARLLSCADCHAPLDRALPFRQNGLLCMDPRGQDTAAHLQRPEHRLQAVDCLGCHAPERGHAFLPYAQRHFDRLACQACHVPSIHAPVLMEEDRSVPGPAAKLRA